MNATLERLRDRAARFEPVEGGVGEGHTMVIDLGRQTTGADGVVGAPDKHEKVSIDIGAPANPPGFDEKVMGMSVGETRAFTVEMLSAGPAEEVVIIGLRRRWLDVERAERAPDPEPVTGSYTLTRRDVESTPGALEDVNRAVHKLPGVTSDSDVLSTLAIAKPPTRWIDAQIGGSAA